MKKTIVLALFVAMIVVAASMSTPIFANPMDPHNSDAVALLSSTSVNPVADTFVNSANPTSSYGGNAKLKVDSSPVIKSYLSFNVSNVSGPITQAKLKLYATASLSIGYGVYAVGDNSWGEKTMTFNNAPAMGSLIGSSGAVSANSWTSVDVTNYVKGNGTFSFGLKNSSGTVLTFDSREAANPPILVVTTGTTSTTATPTASPTAKATTTPAPLPTATPVSSGSGSGSCSFTIGTGVTTADGKGNYAAVKPGQTVCISAGNRAGLKLINFKGTASAPITFINQGGQVVINNTGGSGGIGIQLYGSQYIRLTGTGTPGLPYGIAVYNAANSAVDTNHAGSASQTDGTQHVEFDHLYAQNVGAGFRTAKNNDLLDSGIVWSGTQFWIHDNWINTTANEAMYIGTSDTHGSFPIYDVQVWNNRIDNAGYDGIQIRQAHTKVLVHHNTINGTGRDPRKNGTIDNAAAFNIAKGTDTGDWYANTVIGARKGFYIKDSANARIYNNLVIDSGHTTPYSGAEGAVQILNATNIQFMFNTVVNRTVNGVYGIQIKGSSGSVHDNLVGGSFASLLGGTGMTLAGNQTNANLGALGFVNPGANNYALTAASPAVNKATVSSFPGVDFVNVARPQASASDVGAYEYH